MRHRESNDKKNKNLLKTLISLSIVIMIGMALVCVVAIVLLTMLSVTTKNDAFWVLIIFPVGAAFAAPFIYVINKRAVKHINTLTEGINRVADGDLGTRIEGTKDRIFEDVYDNFNKMVREIHNASELRSKIADNFSHELKTPISSINGCAKLLLDGNLSPERERKYLEIIMHDSELMAKFVQDSLMLSKLDAQEIVTDKTEFDLSEQIRDCLIALSAEWERKNLDISVDLPDCMYYGNRIMLESVWNNLLSNAVKYTPVGGSVSVAMNCTETEVVVKISDKGIGMSEEVVSRIFERFYRAEHTESGHGLGLSIVKKVLDLTGGKISVESKEGEGSAFTVVLPK